MTPAFERFWRLHEMHLQLAQYMEPKDFRVLMCTTKSNFQMFLADGWCELRGIGNLLATLDDSLGKIGTGPGEPAIEVPPIEQLDVDRILTFLKYAEVVQRVRVNGNPYSCPSWLHLNRLLELPVLADRQILMPNVTHFSIQVATRRRSAEIAPFVRLVANARLEQLWISPNVSRKYPRSTLTDAEDVLATLTNAFESNCPLRWLAYYPETTGLEDLRREAMVQRFLPLAQNLCLFTTTIWLISVPLLQALSQSPLERLEIQGRGPVPHGDMSSVGQIEFPDGAFAGLRVLLLQDVPVQFARHLLLSQEIIDKVEILRIEICDINDFEVDEDLEYVTIYQRLAAFPRLRELTLISSRDERVHPYSFDLDFLQPVIDKQLYVLRLFRFGIPGGLGFSQLRPLNTTQWNNLVALTVMHQDLTEDDLIYFARLPNLADLGGNVPMALGNHRGGSITVGFSRYLTFASQFRIGIPYAPARHTRVVENIVNILDEVTPNGMALRVDRVFSRIDRIDLRDYDWVRAISSRLKDLDKDVPNKLQVVWPTR